MNEFDTARLDQYLFRITLALEEHVAIMKQLERSVAALADSDLERLRTREALARRRRLEPPTPTDPPKEDGE